jgi:SAM-dependent methyltransferase
VAATNARDFANRARAESFGARAEQYDSARPGYPDALMDDLLALAPRDALDVGCGTGKASVPLAQRGVQVLGVEIDARMAAVARRNGIAVEIASFEGWPDNGRRFDLLLSAQAWHWVDPVRGAAKAARLLRENGSVALFWNVGDFEASIRERMHDLYRSIAPSGLGLLGAGAPVSHTVDRYRVPLRASGLARQRTATYDWQQTYTGAEWLRLLATHSDHATLPEEVRTRLRSRIGTLIEELGGTITIEYATQLLLASREPA